MPDAKTDFTTNIPAKIAANPDKAKEIGATFLFKISGDEGGSWLLDLKDNVGVTPGDVEGLTPDCTLELTGEDWRTMSETPGAAMQLYFQGKLKVSGNAMLATKLTQILG